ncbi:MAG: hypothetical protein AB7I34_02535 [Rhizobiaceae bacterium]
MQRPYLLALAAILATPAFGADETETVGGWQITTKSAEGAALNPTCVMVSPAGPTRLRIENIQAPDAKDHGAGSITVIFNDRVVDAKTQPLEGLTFNVTRRVNWGPVTGEWKEYQAGGYVSAVVTNDVDKMLKPLVQGSQISFELNGQPYSVSLKGSTQAAFAFERCLQKVKLTQ